ncbi:MAG: TonB family protein [Gammaproteobacteria bacterium]|nr:TonB family protein [Gammaproteobacteria bacterium]
MVVLGRFTFSLGLAVAVNLLLIAFVHWMVNYEPRWNEPVSMGQLMSIMSLPSTGKPVPATVDSSTSKSETEQAPAPLTTPPPPIPPLFTPLHALQQTPQLPALTARAVSVPLRLGARPALDGLTSEAAPEVTEGATTRGESQAYQRLTPVHRQSPRYPRRAKRSGVEGVVTVAFTVTTTGSVRDPKVIKSNPPGVFDRVVLSAIKHWRFASRHSDVRAVQDITFTLKNR